jgi:hypothetical protein
MNWEVLGTIADIGAGLGVIITLFYLATQIRQNTRATFAEAYQRFTDSINSTNQLIASDPVLARIVSELAFKNFDEFSAEDRVRLSHILLCDFRAVESLYYHHVEGAAARRAWDSQAKMIRDFVGYMAVRTWWPRVETLFDPEFRDYVQTCISQSADVETPKWV